MSKNILVVESSARTEGSYSRLLVKEFLDLLQSRDGALNVVRRDLTAQPVPTLQPNSVDAIRAKPGSLTDTQQQAGALSETLIDELKAADIIVIGAPMYNWGIPGALKAWIDQIVRLGYTFNYGASGPVGELKNKRTLIALSRGGIYSRPDYSAMDFQQPYLDRVLRVLGLEPEFVLAEGTLMGPEALDASLVVARQAMKAISERFV